MSNAAGLVTRGVTAASATRGLVCANIERNRLLAPCTDNWRTWEGLTPDTKARFARMSGTASALAGLRLGFVVEGPRKAKDRPSPEIGGHRLAFVADLWPCRKCQLTRCVAKKPPTGCRAEMPGNWRGFQDHWDQGLGRATIGKRLASPSAPPAHATFGTAAGRQPPRSSRAW